MPPSAKTIVLTEGEFDAMAMHQVGHAPVLLSSTRVLTGASSRGAEGAGPLHTEGIRSAGAPVLEGVPRSVVGVPQSSRGYPRRRSGHPRTQLCAAAMSAAAHGAPVGRGTDWAGAKGHLPSGPHPDRAWHSLRRRGCRRCRCPTARGRSRRRCSSCSSGSTRCAARRGRRYPECDRRYSRRGYQYPCRHYQYSCCDYQYPCRDYQFPCRDYWYTCCDYQYPCRHYQYP